MKIAALFLGALLGTQAWVPAGAGGVPADPQIVDQIGDANGINDQVGNAFGVSPHEGIVTGTDLTDVGDIESAWFTTDRRGVSFHIRTEAPPEPASDMYFLLWFDYPGTTPDRPCGGIHVLYAGSNTGASVTSACGGPSSVLLPLFTSSYPDGSGHIRVLVPHSIKHPAFAGGEVIESPVLLSRSYVPRPGGSARVFTYDTTTKGTDYQIP